ncbi:transposase [Desulfosarcina cetonica]|uniref:transposase n=1 Tax=Desulfosarcina cetonica TaxID=90730 RepID=UPI0006D21725|nr:transposase [Desulfosarcina cetonica]
MIRYNDHKQQQLFDPWGNMSPKRRQMLDRSWAGLFKEHILPELPVSVLSPFFNAGFGRPTKNLYTVVGVLILQQAHDLTDEQAVTQLSFNIEWHYALNIFEESDSAKYMCPKTLWNMRTIVAEHGLEDALFNACTQKLAEVFTVDTDKQRLDSVHIRSNMRRLGRISIFSRSIHRFLKNLKRHHPSCFDTIDTAIIDRYFSEKDLACFAMVKPSQGQKTLSQVSNDLYRLVQQFKDLKDVNGMHSFKLLQRILDEQCTVSDDDQVDVKEPKQIPSDSLQNPSDPDASYSGHKGQGYQVQVMETYTDTDDPEEKAQTLNLITHVEVERAHESDANALIPAIESAQEKELAPKALLADSLYGSDENIETAKGKDVEVISPPMGSEKKDQLGLSDFHLEKSGKVIRCPQGHAPMDTTRKKTRNCAVFDLVHCSGCPNKAICPAKSGKKAFYLRFTDKQLRIALRRSAVETDEFKDRYRWRAGVEATMSEFDRRTGVKHLRVRGLKAVRFSAILKALGLNIFRAAAVMAAILSGPSAKSRSKRGFTTSIEVFRERFWTILAVLVRFLERTCCFRAYT